MEEVDRGRFQREFRTPNPVEELDESVEIISPSHVRSRHRQDMSEASIIATLRDVKSELRSIINKEPFHTPATPQDGTPVPPPVPAKSSVFGLKRTRRSHRDSASLRGRMVGGGGSNMYRPSHQTSSLHHPSSPLQTSYDYDIEMVKRENRTPATEGLSERVYRGKHRSIMTSSPRLTSHQEIIRLPDETRLQTLSKLYGTRLPRRDSASSSSTKSRPSTSKRRSYEDNNVWSSYDRNSHSRRSRKKSGKHKKTVPDVTSSLRDLSYEDLRGDSKQDHHPGRFSYNMKS